MKGDWYKFVGMLVIALITLGGVAAAIPWASKSDVEEIKQHIRSIEILKEQDNRWYRELDSEFSGRMVDLWAYSNRVTLEFSRPGKPTDNAYIESFNGSLRDECLNVHWFEDLTDAKEKLQAWQSDYNENRPHRSLNNLSPLQYKAQWAKRRSENC